MVGFNETSARRSRTFGGDRLSRATSRISACITEGYARGGGRDRALFYEYAIGSAREAQDWYYKGRRVLGEKVTEHRIDLHTQMVKLLTKMVVPERQRPQIGSSPPKAN
jgi:four helix bundle protein